MNRYYQFFSNMNDEEWERFAVEVLKRVGYQILTLPAFGTDGGKDFIVGYGTYKALVSCKHYIKSQKHVGADDEVNISDRMNQFGANMFIGFYSTNITTGLQNRLDGICANGNYMYQIYEPIAIINAMQFMDTHILQSFGLYPHKYYMNVSEAEYKPLKCVRCGRDILTDQMIPASLAGIALRKDGTWDYVYGCKACLFGVQLKYEAFLELEQALHVKILQGWEDMIEEWIEEDEMNLHQDFYKHRTKFLNRVRQRQLPQTEGTWYGLDI